MAIRETGAGKTTSMEGYQMEYRKSGCWVREEQVPGELGAGRPGAGGPGGWGTSGWGGD